MAVIRPFRAVRPVQEKAEEVAALPYDVYNREEARKECSTHPLSFLNIDRPETQFSPEHFIYAPDVYEKAAEMLRTWQKNGIFVQDDKPCYYLYELTMNGRAQTGLVALSSVDDYLDGTICRHEQTRKEKEEDRIRHIDVTCMQTGPIFLAYRRDRDVSSILEKEKEKDSLYDFISSDGIRHRVWLISEQKVIESITEKFAGIAHTYIADGHHRAASAVAVSRKRRQEHPGYTGNEEFNYFLSVLFPDEELKIMDYNRVIRDLNGNTVEMFLDKVREAFSVEDAPCTPYRPQEKGEMGMYLSGRWYRLRTLPEREKSDPVECLDTAYLQRELLAPVLGIQDPRTDERIDFVGGIRGLKELEDRCLKGCAVAFALYPTSIGELFAVADAGLLMPPKSTWFEPKLRSGLFLHKIED